MKTQFQKFQRQSIELKAVETTLTKSSFYDFLPLYYVAIFGFLLLKIIEIIASHPYFYSKIHSKINWIELAFILTLSLQLLIEVLLAYSLTLYLRRIYRHPSVNTLPALIGGLLISAGLMYASVMGAAEFTKDTKTPVLIETKFENKIEKLETQIQDIQTRNTWQGNTYIAGEEKKLLHDKEQELKALKEEKKNALSNHKNQEQAQTQEAQYVMAAFELFSLLCIWFVHYFPYCLGIERAIADEKIQLRDDAQPKKVKHLPESKKVIEPVTHTIGFAPAATIPIERKEKGSATDYIRKYPEIVELIEKGKSVNEIVSLRKVSRQTVQSVRNDMKAQGMIEE